MTHKMIRLRKSIRSIIGRNKLLEVCLMSYVFETYIIFGVLGRANKFYISQTALHERIRTNYRLWTAIAENVCY